MKKIIGIMLVIGCLTACNNENIKEEYFKDEIKKEDAVVELNSEESLISNLEEDYSEENITNQEQENNKEIKPEKEQEYRIEDNLDIDVSKKNEEVKIEVDQIETKEKVYEIGVEVGKKALDFEVELLSGEKIKLSDYFGEPIFLNFWATWCGPCVGEMPDIEKIKNEYGDKIKILAINGGEMKEDIKFFIDKNGYTFNIGIDENGSILGKYDSMYIPLSIFIDKNGVISKRQVGALSYDKMKEFVDELLVDTIE